MKVRGKKLLAAMLSLTMVLSMFVVPASAVEGEVTAGIYQLSAKGHAGAQGSQITSAEGVPAGIIFDSSFDYSNDHGPKSNGGKMTVNIPAGKYSTLVITTCQHGAGGTVTTSSGNIDTGKAATGSTDSGKEFTITNATGTTEITFGGAVYVHGITVGEFTDAAAVLNPSLALDKESVVVKMGETATVTPTVENPGSETYTITAAASDGEATVAATVGDGNAITIDPKAAGKTTVTVTATPGSGEALTATIAVRVPPTEIGTVAENQTVTYRGSKNEALADKYYVANGLEWGTAMKLDNDHGPYASNPTLKVHIPTDKKTTLTVTTCCYGNGGTPTVTGGTLSETTEVTDEQTGKIGYIHTITDAEGTVTIAFTGTTYIHEIKVGAFTGIGTTPDPEPAESVEAGTIDFQALAADVTPTETIGNNSYGAVPIVKGLTVSADALVQTGGSHGLYAKNNGVTVTLKLSAAAKITLVECQYGKDKITKVIAGGTDVTLPTPTGDADRTYVFEDVPEGNFVLTLNSGAYIHSIAVEYAAEPGPEPEPGNGKVDVYDFGAEQLDETKFNNKLTADDINAWYDGVTPGTDGKTLPATVTAGKFTYQGDKAGTRLRTTNTALTRYDSTNLSKCKPPKGSDPYDPDRTDYTGTLASNGATFTLKLTTGAGDKLTYIMGNGNKVAYTAEFTGADGNQKTEEVPVTHGAVSFYAPKAGTQTLFSSVTGVDGAASRPVVARIYVERPTAVTVSGNLDTTALAAADAAKVKLVFTNDDSGLATEATVSGSTYTVSLNNYQAGATYTVTAEGITGGVILAGETLALTGETATHNVTVGQVNLVDVSGPITGMSTDADSLGRLKFTLTPPEGNIYIPEVTLNGDAWSAKLQSGVEYTVTAENVNDYILDTKTVKYDAPTTAAAIAFTAKTTHAVTIVPTGLTLAELADATFTFTNISETYEDANGKDASYVYSFTGPNAIALRDGQYTVKVDTAKGRQELTPDVKVNGAAVTCPVSFDVEAPTEWDFRVANAAAMNDAARGLTLTGVTYHSTNYGSTAKGGTYAIPVPGPCTITVSVGYNWDVYMPEAKEHNTAATSYKDKTNSGDIDVTFDYEGEAGTVTLTTGTEFASYVKAIKVAAASSTEYKDTVTVGEGKDCATITEALELVAKMPRPNNERVTIVIDPGDYEEQLRVDVPNVTLKNAKAAEAKLELKDKGVGIGSNEVRVTHYYGHGYTYYSMTNGHRYDEKVLAVNKANGYPSYINKGSGSTDDSYWNASVVVNASGFRAEGIIFENSFNQYVSAKAANDVIVPQSGAAKESANAPRASLPQGSTDVQYKTYVERAAALAITNNKTEIFFDNCAFIGRQDTLYGGRGVTAAFYDCDVYGGTDFIMGVMNAVFAKCDLVMNTSENNNDVAYITAGQQDPGGRGYLMYNCSVISTVPGVNTASALASKPGSFGRPWTADCEVIFYETIVDSTTTTDRGAEGTEEVSLIQPIGWTEGLNGGGHFERCGEYHTHESAGVDNSASRHANANVFTEPKLADGTAIDYETWLGGWTPFEDKDMTVVGCPDTSRTVTFQVDAGASVTDLAADGKATALNGKNQLVALKEAVVTFQIDVSDGYTLSNVTGATWNDESVYTVAADTVVINTTRNQTGGGGGDMVPTGSGNKGTTVTNPDGSKTTTKTDRKGNTTVTTVATDGSKVEKLTTKAGDKTITVTNAKGEVQAKVELPADIPSPEAKFTDVPEGHWAEKAINDMAGLGTVKGVSDGVFDMNSPITRGSVATILYRLSNVDFRGSNAFTDVADDEWYAEAVTWAAATGVVTGYSDTTFGPKDSITREQFAVMLYRYAKLLRLDTAKQAELKSFQDADAVADWSAEAMGWCVGVGILNGVSDPVQGITLSPAKTASRAECATMLDRFITLL